MDLGPEADKERVMKPEMDRLIDPDSLNVKLFSDAIWRYYGNFRNISLLKKGSASLGMSLEVL